MKKEVTTTTRSTRNKTLYESNKMKVVLRTTMFLAFGTLFMAHNALAMAPQSQHNHIRRAATTTNAEEEDEDPSHPDHHHHHQQQQPAPLSHLRHLSSLSSSSSTNNYNSGDLDLFLPFADLAAEAVVIELNEKCEPAPFVWKNDWLLPVGGLDENTCSTKKTVEFELKDSIKPVIICGLEDKEQCNGNDISLDFCMSFDADGKYKPPVFNVTDNCPLQSGREKSTVEDLVLSDEKCQAQKFQRIYKATDGCNNAEDVTLTFKVDPPNIVVTFPTDQIPTVECKEDHFPTLTGTQTICETSEDIKLTPPDDEDPRKKCGPVDVTYTYTDKCAIDKTLVVKVNVTDSDHPVFSCRSESEKGCPQDDTVCSVPKLQLCADDCQWDEPICVDGSQSTVIDDKCKGGVVTQKWEVQGDGCGNDGDYYDRKLTIPGQQPSDPYLQEPHPGCGETPIFCVNVTVCGETPQTETRCSDNEDYADDFKVTAVIDPNTPSICADIPEDGVESSNIQFKKSVTYTDPETQCVSSIEITYDVSCCCETAWAVWNTESPDINCFSKGFPPELKSGKWGWTMGPINLGDDLPEQGIYAAAGDCNLSKGYLAGHAKITYTSLGGVTVEITAEDKVLFTIAHIWVGNEPLPRKQTGDAKRRAKVSVVSRANTPKVDVIEYTAAPGQLGYTSAPYNQGTGTISSTWPARSFTGAIYVAVHTASALSCTAPYYNQNT